MKIALVNPPWSFEGSIYFGCREPHLPLELGYAKALLEREGHDVLLLDAQLGFTWRSGAPALDAAGAQGVDVGAIRAALETFGPDATAIATAPSYLFWRCAPPELRVPIRTIAAVRDVAGATIAVGPHASTTPGATLRKLGVDVAVLGECEDVLVALARTPRAEWRRVESTAHRDGSTVVKNGEKHQSDMKALPALRWPGRALRRHAHHHHRFERPAEGPGAEIEASRGCPYRCTFCAKNEFRDTFRKRPLAAILDELDALIDSGVRYVYFIDEIFIPDRRLLEALCERNIQFGVQLRIDNWSPEMLALLGRAGCVSIEGGMESITERGRSLLAKHCKLDTPQLTELFITAKRHVPFVQANLLDAATDRKEDVAAWCKHLAAHGVWANEPVPMFVYPGSPEYAARFGPCDDTAWERAQSALAELAPHRIEFGGWLPNFRVPDVLAQYTLTVHVPRRPYARALPGIPTIRVFEALACEAPLVSGRWDDVEGLFSPGKDYLVANDTAQMRAHLRMLLNDAEARRELARHGGETTRRRHTCAHRVDELAAIVRSLGAGDHDPTLTEGLSA